MTKSRRLGRRQPLLALLFIGTALTGVAHAADPQTITGISKTYAPGLSIEIPSIVITDGSLPQATVEALLAGDAKAWGSLATLTAGSIAIPEVTLRVDPSVGAPASTDGTTTPATAQQPVTVTLHDLDLTGVTDGVASSVAVGGLDITQQDAPVFHFGALTASDFSIGGYLAMYGLTDRQYTEMSQLYSAFSFEGGKVTAPGADCTIAGGSSGEALARSIKIPYADYMAAAQKLGVDAAGENEPDAKSITTMAHYLADALQAMKTEPMNQAGFDCAIQVPGEDAVAVSATGITVGGFEPTIYPAFGIDGLKVRVDGESGGHFNLDNFTWKKMDFSGPIAAVEAKDLIDWDWLTANAMKLVPAMDGLSLTGLDFDVPDSSTEGERVAMTLASLDATLGHYVDGVPADLALRFDDLKVNLPKDQTDGPAPELIARGITRILLDGEATVRWDETGSDLIIDNIAFDSPELGHVALSATLGNASKDLFSTNEQLMQAAAMALTLKSATLSVEDRGIAGIMFSAGARESGQPEPAFRATLSGMSQGMLMAALGNSDAALAAAQAVGQFMLGKPKLEMTLTSKEAAGMPIAMFAAASENPTLLAGQLTVTAEASGDPLPPPPEPVTAPPAEGNGDSVTLEMNTETPAAPAQPAAPAPQPTAPGTGGGAKSGVGLTLQ